MTLEELKDLMLKVSMGRRDAADQVAELLFSLLKKQAEKPKKAIK